MKKDMMIGGVGAAIVALTTLGSVTAEAQNYTNTFPNSASIASAAFEYDGAVLTPTVTFGAGPTFDAGGSAASGSAKLSWSWDASAFPLSSAGFTFTINGVPQNFSGDVLSFDLRLASSSTAGDNGDYGIFQVYARNSNALTFQSLAAAGGLRSEVTALDTWTHVVIPMGANGNALRAITFEDDNFGGQIVGSETIYIDNLTIAAPVPEPSIIALAGLGVASLVAARRLRKN